MGEEEGRESGGGGRARERVGEEEEGRERRGEEEGGWEEG